MPIKGKLPLEENPLAEWKKKVGKSLFARSGCIFKAFVLFRPVSMSVCLVLLWGKEHPHSIPFSLFGLWSRISVTCQTLLAFVPGPQKSPPGAYKLIIRSKRFECERKDFAKDLPPPSYTLIFCAEAPGNIFASFWISSGLGIPITYATFLWYTNFDIIHVDYEPILMHILGPGRMGGGRLEWQFVIRFVFWHSLLQKVPV